MNERLINFLDLVTKVVLVAYLVIFPLTLWNLTSEFYELPKFLLLLLVTLLMLILWVTRFLLTGKTQLLRTPLDLPLLLLLGVFGLSTFFAPSRSVALLGNFPRIHEGLITFSGLTLFYLLFASQAKLLKLAKLALYPLILSGAILSLSSLISYWGINVLPFTWASTPNFTPTGSNFSTTAILALLLPLLLLQIANSSKLPYKLLVSGIAALFAITIALTGSLATFIAAGAAVALTLLFLSPSSMRKNLPLILLPGILGVVVFILSVIPSFGTTNPLYERAQKFPSELQLSFDSSWKISISAFRDSPFWGSGPGSYMFNFTAYKPADLNTTKNWAVKFDQSFNEYLHLLATTGGLGLVSLLLLTTVFLSTMRKVASTEKDPLVLGLALSGGVFFILLALHTSTLALWGVGMIILALFMGESPSSKEIELTAPSYKEAGKIKPHFDTLPTLLLLVTVGLVAFSVYYGSRFVVADYHRRLALNAVAAGKALDAYNQLVIAEKLNPYVDIYRADLAQTNFALANALASAKKPSEASPGGNLSDQDKQTIQTFLSQAINEGKNAVAINRNSSLNWEILASIYKQISGVAQNAPAFALDAYGRAIQRDPYNPVLRLSVGGMYYSLKNYDMALRFFTDAVNLKPDYANGYYNIAVALKDKGDLQGAKTMAEKTISLLDPNSPDYKTASDLLASLNDQTAQKEAEIKEPEEKSALQDKKLPKVLNLPKPEKVATPEAINKTTTPAPTVTSPTPTP